MKNKWDPRKESRTETVRITEKKSDELVEEIFELLNSIDIEKVEEKKLIKDDKYYGEFPHTYIWKHRTPSKKILRKQLKMSTSNRGNFPYSSKDLNKITRHILKAFNLQAENIKWNKI